MNDQLFPVTRGEIDNLWKAIKELELHTAPASRPEGAPTFVPLAQKAPITSAQGASADSGPKEPPPQGGEVEQPISNGEAAGSSPARGIPLATPPLAGDDAEVREAIQQTIADHVQSTDNVILGTQELADHILTALTPILARREAALPSVLGHAATKEWCEAVDAHHAATEQWANNEKTEKMNVIEDCAALRAQLTATQTCSDQHAAASAELARQLASARAEVERMKIESAHYSGAMHVSDLARASIADFVNILARENGTKESPTLVRPASKTLLMASCSSCRASSTLPLSPSRKNAPRGGEAEAEAAKAFAVLLNYDHVISEGGRRYASEALAERAARTEGQPGGGT